MAPRKVFISVDAEGMPYVPYRKMLSPGDPLYNELRDIMTRVTRVTVDALHDMEVEHVIVADSHGSMVNLRPLEMPGYVELIRGFPRSLMMVTGANEADAGIFLGYHSSPGVGGVLSHTYAGRIVQRVTVNGYSDVTEYYLNLLALGEMGVPLIMVAGDSALEPCVKKHTPWAAFLALKKHVSTLADRSIGWPQVEYRLKKAVEKAIEIYEEGKAEPVKPENPEILLELKRPWHADIAELYPCVERIDGVRVKLTCDNYLDNLKLMEGIIIAAYSLER